MSFLAPRTVHSIFLEVRSIACTVLDYFYDGYFIIHGSCTTRRNHCQDKTIGCRYRYVSKNEISGGDIDGKGFAVGDGLHIVTNAHVIPDTLDLERMEKQVVITGRNNEPDVRDATVIFRDKAHDIALLKISGTALPPLTLGDSDLVKEGRRVAFTGFPIGMVLGFFPATHQAFVSSITPIIRPVNNAVQLDANLIRQLKTPFMVFQLDGVAYPGNSGSPLYDPDTGVVYGIINMVFVKGKKEAALSAPSGISYAIPGKHIVNMLNNAR